MRIALLTNSQGTATGLERDASYPLLVRDALSAEHETFLFAKSGWSIRDFNANLGEILECTPDVVVLQVGIVECARRILSTREKAILRRVPGSQRFTLWLHNRRKRVIRLRRALRIDTRLYTASEFRAELDALASTLRARAIATVLLEIPAFSESYAADHFPYVNEDIESFNRILRQFGAVPFLDPSDVDRPIWQAGTVHLTEEGHRLAADRLVARIRSSEGVEVHA